MAWPCGRRGTARMRNDRRRRRECLRSGADRCSTDRRRGTDPSWRWSSREELEALHEEVSRLPERYRIPVVLCELEGLTYHEAALRLRCPVEHDRRTTEAGAGAAPPAADSTGPGPHGRTARRTPRRGSGFSAACHRRWSLHRPGRDAVRGEQGRGERAGLGGVIALTEGILRSMALAPPQAGGEPGAGRRDRRDGLAGSARNRKAPVLAAGGASQARAHRPDAAPRAAPADPARCRSTRALSAVAAARLAIAP